MDFGLLRLPSATLRASRSGRVAQYKSLSRTILDFGSFTSATLRDAARTLGTSRQLLETLRVACFPAGVHSRQVAQSKDFGFWIFFVHTHTHIELAIAVLHTIGKWC
ncbi:hypothetical protein [Nostoc sp.]|uniref:hypothetical protein n=1 Tax=Nostoc sp. TaxID=1180 RepID=UPI002FFA4E15